jgi:cellulose synthase/poly-beta-1,6-N-acetylglucosamine synthase-like glycosyltransferase
MGLDGKDEPFVSIAIATRNESRFIANCLDSLRALDYPKDRVNIIVVDGLSNDNTQEIAHSYGVKVAMNPKATEPAGRKLGVGLATGDLIAFTDADCVVDRNWLRNSLRYFVNEKVAGVGGINLTPRTEEAFGKAVGFVFSLALSAPGTYHARILKEVRRVPSLPWCNAIYRRAILERVTPIDDSLLTAADAELNQRINAMGYELLYTPDVLVWHHRRCTPAGLWSQLRGYAIGRVQLSRRCPHTLHPTHVLVGLAIPLLAVAGVGLSFLAPELLLILGGAAVLGLLFFSALAFLKEKSIKVALQVPVVISTMLLGWSFGFLRELLFPLKIGAGR